MTDEAKRRAAIWDVVTKEGYITKKDAVKMFKNDYFINAEKYVGEILSRMVKNGTLIRQKPGVFIAGKGKVRTVVNCDVNQTKLF